MCCCRKRQPRPLSEPEIDRSGSPRGSARRYASLEPRIHRTLGDRSTSCTLPIGVLAPLSRTHASPRALLPGRILKGRPACVHPPYWGFSDGNESPGAEAPRPWPTPSKTACQPMPPERPWPASARRSCGLSRAAPTRTLTPSRPSARKEAYLAKLAQDDHSILLVSASDKLHNARPIVRDLRGVGEPVGSLQRAESRDALVLPQSRHGISGQPGAHARPYRRARSDGRGEVALRSWRASLPRDVSRSQ